ncbi:hypothetical protein BK708_24900 [Bacillus thuringiensis serovar yunnanensis]|nr:hypothetical protein BK708_24900 [Bacillus thuringiensis serovar yunnanensis]
MQSSMYRKIKLLELLASEKRWFKTSEINEKIGHSPNTIYQDVSSIRNVIPESWKIEVQKGKGIQLYIPPSASIDEMISLLLKKSDTFKILKVLFNQKEISLVDLAEELYVSIPTAALSVINVEKYLKKYNLQLQRKPLKIIGNEIQITIMYYELYLKIYGYYDWPFKEYSESFMSTFINNIEEVLNVTFSLTSRKKLFYFTAVLLKRKKQGESLHLREEFIEQNVNTPYYKKMQKVYELLETENNVSLNTEEKVIFTSLIECTKYISKDVKKEKAEILQHLTNEDVLCYNYVKDFICMLDEKFGLNLINHEDLVLDFILCFRQKVYQLYYLSMFRRTDQKDQKSIKYIEEKHLATFLVVKQVYTDWVKKYKIAKTVPDEEVANITMFVESTYLLQKVTCKKALLVTSEGDSWGNYLKAMLYKRLGNKLEIVNDYSIQLVDKKELKLEIDFIISTIPLNIRSIPIVMISTFPTRRDFMNIEFWISSLGSGAKIVGYEKRAKDS